MNDAPQLSVVVPVYNEEGNVAPLVGEIVAALRGRIPFEIVYVDDLSKDATLARLAELKAATPELRVVRHLANGGQSTAIRNGIKAIWNFAPTHLDVPPQILVQNENMATSLAVLSKHLSAQMKGY